MPADPQTSGETPDLGIALLAAIAERYGESGAERYGIKPVQFQEMVAAVVMRYAANTNEAGQLELLATVRVGDLILARACSAGSNAAWDVFLTRFRVSLYDAAYRIARDDATGRELADSLYAELYGMPNREGRRISKLDYYMGRGSLEGWLRTVLAQAHVNRCRSLSKVVSLDEQVESGVAFAGKPSQAAPVVDDRVAAAVALTLAELDSEDRVLLASYYLDRSTLAAIGRQLGVHESTISRKLERLTGAMRKRIRKRLQADGMDHRLCDEAAPGSRRARPECGCGRKSAARKFSGIVLAVEVKFFEVERVM